MSRSAKSHGAVVIGADIEGLAAAITLAEAGQDVAIVDACAHVGGAHAAREIHPGHVVPGLTHELALTRRSLLGSLGLASHGLDWHADEIPLHVIGGEQRLILHRDADQCEGLGSDAAAYGAWRTYVTKLSGLIVDIIDDAPPEAEAPGLGEMLRLAKKGLKLRTLGDRDMMELLRIITMPAWDWTDEWFESATLRAGLTAPILQGTVVGPRAAGTTAMILMREAAAGSEPIGGAAAIVEAMRSRCEQLGVTLRLGDAPTEILCDGQRATGVRLESGATLDADLLVSAWDAGRTLGDLIDPVLLPHDVDAEVRHWRTRGATAVHLLALSDGSSLPSGAMRWTTTTTPLQLERAADALKYGDFPDAPWLDVRVWQDAAPSGAATLSVHVHGVSHDLRARSAGWNDAARDELKRAILDTLEAAAPGLRGAIVAEQLLVPSDLEAEFGLSGGHLFGGEIALDQLWVQRPSLALCRYSTPIEALFLGGSSSHPGGAFLGGSGVLAARMALRS